MSTLFNILDGIISSDYRDEILDDTGAVMNYAEAAGKEISYSEAELISEVGKRWLVEQEAGNGEWDRMRREARQVLAMLDDPESYVIIDDGAFRYPMARAELGDVDRAALRAMSGDEYSAWCQDHPHASPEEVGTGICIVLSLALEAAGSDYWHIAR